MIPHLLLGKWSGRQSGNITDARSEDYAGICKRHLHIGQRDTLAKKMAGDGEGATAFI